MSGTIVEMIFINQGNNISIESALLISSKLDFGFITVNPHLDDLSALDNFFALGLVEYQNDQKLAFNFIEKQEKDFTVLESFKIDFKKSVLNKTKTAIDSYS